MMPDNNDDIPDESAKQNISNLNDEVEGHLNDSEVSQDREQQQQPDRRSENMNRLSQSTRQLLQSVDEKLKVSESAKKVDEKVQISSTTSRGWNNLTNWYSSSGLGDKTKQATAVISSSVRNLDEKLHISETASGATRGVKEWDEKNKLSEKVTGSLASGMEYVSTKVCTTNDIAAFPPSDASADATKGSDKKDGGADDFPSSFQK